MSLVAYASSEEEEEEEESDSAEEEEAEEEQGGGGSDGEEEPEAGAEGPARGLFSALPPPKAVPGLSRLPPPPQTAFPPGPSSPPAVEPSPPSRPRKRRQPVRIAAPQLLLLHAGESDSEEDEPAKKHPASQGHSEGAGLSALLPQPKNLTVKEANRPLLPYVFTRKVAENAAGPKGLSSTSSASLKMPPLQPGSAAAVLTTPSPSAIKAAAKSAALQVTKQITQEENDSDEEVAPENYFSLPERSEPPALTPPAYVFPGPPTVPDDLPPGTEPEGQEAAGANAPLEFKTGAHPASHSWAPKPAEDHGNRPYAPYPAYSDAGGPAAYYQQDYYSSGYYQQTGPTLGPLQEVSPAADTASSSSSSSSSFFMDDEAFKRLQGKRNRGREEVNFVEIKGDDQLSGAQQWLTKSLTEEQNRKSFSKKKGEQPTGQQRRKHQITYLIHQAKERELELKNTWAENKLSRRQTQAKYGF